MTMRWLMLVMVLLCPVPIMAQSALPWVFHSGATATGNGAELPAEYFSTIVVQIEGSFVGDIEFQKKTKDASSFVAVQCTNASDLGKATVASEPGYWECPGGAYRFRAVVTSYTSGTIVVTGNGTTAVSSRGSGGGTDGWPLTLSSVASTSEAAGESVRIRGKGAQANNGEDAYQSSAGFFERVCVVSGVRNACNYIRQLASGFYTEIRNHLGNPIFTLTNDTGKLTNVTIDCEETGNNCTLYGKLCGGDLVGVDPATGTAGHIWNKSPLDTAPTAVAVTGTNRTFGTARHPDSDGDYGVQLTCQLPPGFTGNLDARVWWTTAGTGSAVLQIATKCYTDNAADDAAFNTATPYTLPAGTASRPQTQILGNIQRTGCSADQLMRVRVFRNRTHASDTLASGTFDLEKLELWARSTY